MKTAVMVLLVAWAMMAPGDDKKKRRMTTQPEGLLINQCHSVPPPVPVPGGGQCVALGCKSVRGMVVGYPYQCPPGWKVQSGQAVPWNP